jgi:para-nitrobenzyl esterase
MAIGVWSDAMRVASIRLAERKLALGGAPVFMYKFAWPSPAKGGILRAIHGLEVRFAFDNVDTPNDQIGDSPERLVLANRVSSAWAAFAANGHPGHEGLPEWPRYTHAHRATMVFHNECSLDDNAMVEELKAWGSIGEG